ncbi:MAG: helix-hairpin-helix domain-containing protein [Candidatus Cloacimonetes bacterium]|nr:helix-hairpin-helix domain-containing protein [Candidatus Cloacimonadota bacterium]
MKNFLNNYCTKSEQKAVILILLLVLLATFLYSQNEAKESEVINPDSLNVMLQRPNLPNLNIHTAKYEDWVLVPGLGTKRAKDIVEFRDFYGFSIVNDLMKVKGIGINTVKSIIAYGYGLQYKPTSQMKSTDPKATDTKTIELIDLNKATFEQLVSIHGIGNFRAQGIIEMRERVGRFKKFDELLDINGIGPKTVKIIEQNTYLGQE